MPIQVWATVMKSAWLPLQDPVSGEPMVLVSIYNVTSEKELMLQLQDTKEQLQQKNQVRQLAQG